MRDETSREPLLHENECNEINELDPAELKEFATAAPLSARETGDELPLTDKKKCFTCACLIGNILVLLFQMVTVANAELMQIQETGTHPYLHPYFSVWFNHCVTGVFSAIIAAIWLAVTKQSFMGVLRENGFSTFCQAFWTATGFAVFIMFNIFWSVSLPLVTVSVFTTITQTTCVFVLVFSIIFFKHAVRALEVVSVLFCIGGVVIISFLKVDPDSSNNGTANTSTIGAFLSDSDNPSNSLVGIACVVAFTVLQAAYLVVWGWRFSEKRTKASKRASQALLPIMIALIGLTNALFLWPFFFTNAWLGWEPPIELPTGTNLTIVLSGSVLASASNILFMLAAVLASPFFLAVGQVLQIPLSILSDLGLHGEMMTLVQGLGCALIVVGFVVQVVSDYKSEREKTDRID